MDTILPNQQLKLLILQRHAAVARAWARCLRTSYANVEALHTIEQVSARLRQASPYDFDVVTGNWFGDGELTDYGCVESWRRCPALRHVLIATALPPKRVPEGVLAVVAKPCGPEELLRWLRPAQYQSRRAA